MSSFDQTTATFANYERSERFQASVQNFAKTLFDTLKSKVDPDNPKHQALLQHWESRINHSSILEQSVCNGLISDISSLIADKNPGAAQQFRQDAMAAIDKVSDAIQKDTVKEEDQWKFKALQILAIATPLGLFTAFNYLEFAANIFGPIFGEAGVAAGIGEAGTKIPFFGKIFEAARMDDGIEYLLADNPFPVLGPAMGDIFELVSDIFGLELVQEIGGEVAPVAISSEILMVAAATGLVINKLPADLDRDKEKKSVANVQAQSQAQLEGSLQKVGVAIDKANAGEKMQKQMKNQQNQENEKPNPTVRHETVTNPKGQYSLPVKQNSQNHAQRVEQERLVPKPQVVQQ